MKIYIDLVLFLNFAFDFFLLLAVSYLLKRRTKIRRLFLGALVGSSSLLALFLSFNSFTLFLFKIGISVFMILSTFGFHNRATFIKNFIYLYFVSILLGGGMYLLNIQFSYKNEGLIFFYQGISINFLLLFLLGPILLYYYVKEIHHLPFHRSVYHSVTLYFSSQKILTLQGYLDTGNQLYDPYHHRPILLVSSAFLAIPYEKAILVPYETVQGKGVLRCRKIKKIVIDEENVFKNVLIAQSNKEFHLHGAEVIIHPDFMK